MNIILGTLNFDYKSVSESFDQNKINKILSLANSNGIKTVDTAYYYGNTEKLLGNSNMLQLFNINSKANPWYNNDFSLGKLGQLNKAGISYQINNSLKSLNISSFDTYFLHSWDYETDINETLHVFDEYYRKELFNYFGVSNISPIQLNSIINICENNKLNLSPDVYQGMYNLYCRNIEELFTTFIDYNIKFQCYNPLAGGLLTGKYYYMNQNNTIENGRFINNSIYKSIFWNDLVVDYTKDLTADISLRWLRNHSKLRPEDSIIIGCSSEKQLVSNLKSLSNNNYLSNDEINIVNNFYKKSFKFQPNYFY